MAIGVCRRDSSRKAVEGCQDALGQSLLTLSRERLYRIGDATAVEIGVSGRDLSRH
jgi:hypothetical protein